MHNAAVDLIILLKFLEVSSFLLLDAVHTLGEGQLGAVPPLGFDFLLDLGFGCWVLTDGGVALGVHAFHSVSGHSSLDESRELFLVCVLIIVRQLSHVVSDVLAEDVVTVNLGRELARLTIVSWESLGAVWDLESAVDGSLHGTEHTSAGGGAGKTYIEVTSECTWLSIFGLYQIFVTIDLIITFIDFIETEFVEDSPGEEETGAISGGVVRQPDLHSVSWEFMGICGTYDNVSFDLRVGYLASDVLVGETDDHPVFGSIIFVLILNGEAFAGIVVGSTFPPPLELNLESFKVGLVLYNFNKTHF